MTKQLYKSLEENLKKMSEYSSQLENEREMKKKEYLEKDRSTTLVSFLYIFFMFCPCVPNLKKKCSIHKQIIINYNRKNCQLQFNIHKLVWIFFKHRRSHLH